MQRLILFHGWGCDSRIWQPILPRLSLHYEVHCVDLPGFGVMPWMPWDEWKADVLKTLLPCDAVMGWSLGGLYATRLAIELPGYINRVINVCSSPYFIEEVGDWPGIALSTWHDFHAKLHADPEKTRRQFMQMQGHNVVASHIVSEEGLIYGLEALSTWDLRSQLYGLSIPVHYIFGRLDAIVPRKLSAVMCSRYPLFTYHTMRHAAHAPFLSHTSMFFDALFDLF